MRRLLLAVVAAGLVAIAAGFAVGAVVVAPPGISREQAETVAVRAAGGAEWTVDSVHRVSVVRHLAWFPYSTPAWEVDLLSPGGQAQIVVDGRDGTVLSASAETA